jgi:hypothetical protein
MANRLLLIPSELRKSETEDNVGLGEFRVERKRLVCVLFGFREKELLSRRVVVAFIEIGIGNAGIEKSVVAGDMERGGGCGAGPPARRAGSRSPAPWRPPSRRLNS